MTQKVTSYLISKQLAEAGFRSSYEWLWEHNGIGPTLFRPNTSLEDLSIEQLVKNYNYFPAYDLGALVEALNASSIRIESRGIYKKGHDLQDGVEVFYEPLFESPSYSYYNQFMPSEEDEALVDTVARLLLGLHDNLIGYIRGFR